MKSVFDRLDFFSRAKAFAMGIFDASTSGNLLAYGTLTTSKSVSAGDVFRFNASAIDITLT